MCLVVLDLVHQQSVIANNQLGVVYEHFANWK
jgi:hypothetical protein